MESKYEEPKIWDDDAGPVEDDVELALEIARYIAERAFRFDHHEFRAWAMTDFEVWASLAGREPSLGFVPDD